MMTSSLEPKGEPSPTEPKVEELQVASKAEALVVPRAELRAELTAEAKAT